MSSAATVVFQCSDCFEERPEGSATCPECGSWNEVVRRASHEPGIASIVGRWARLTNGDLVTAIPTFAECGRDQPLFEGLVNEFQNDPAGFLRTNRLRTRLRDGRKVPADAA